jgi:hypothetical protein
MPIPRHALAAVVLCSVLPAALLGQARNATPAQPASQSDVRFSGSFGLGYGSEGGAGLFSLALRTAAGDFIARSAGTFDLAPGFGRTQDLTDVGLLYGRLSESRSRWVRIAAGPSYMERRRDGDVLECAFIFCLYEQERSQGMGLAIQLEGALRPRRTLGIGLSSFANLNRVQTFAGVTLSLHIGRVSRRSGPG